MYVILASEQTPPAALNTKAVPPGHWNGRVYQQDVSPSESSSSAENSQRLSVHPGPGNVASTITRVHTDDGSVEAAGVQGSGSIAQKSPAHHDRPPISTFQQSPPCEQPSGFGYAKQTKRQQDQEKLLSPPEEDEDPSTEEPKAFKSRELGSKVGLVVGPQRRAVRKPPASLLPPGQEKWSPSHGEVAAQAQPEDQVQEGPSLNLDTPIAPNPDFPETSNFSSALNHRLLTVGPCCSIAQDSRNEDSDDHVTDANEYNVDVEVDNDFERCHGSCSDRVVNHLAQHYPVTDIRFHPNDEEYRRTDSGDDVAEKELRENNQVGGDESTAEVVDGQDEAEVEGVEDSTGEHTNLHILSQLLGAASLVDPTSEGHASDNNHIANVRPPSTSPPERTISPPGTSSYSDAEASDQDPSSSETDKSHEDPDHDVYGHGDSDDEMDEEEAEYLSDLLDLYESGSGDSNPTNSKIPTQPATSSGRRRLTTEERELVRQTREIGACVRCRFQKIKCIPNLRNPEGKCKTCQRFSKTSPKTIHRVPCLRLRIIEIVLYRSGGLNLTQRWKGIEMRDIPERVAMPSITIEVSQDLCKKPIRLKVVQFIPQDGDVTARYWTECFMGQATLKKKELATYCLESIFSAAGSVRKYTVENAIPAFVHMIQKETKSGCESDPIRRTYYTAVGRYMALNREKRSGNTLSSDDNREAEILGNLFLLWCAIQHTVGSLYIQGDETLGMMPETQDKSYPLYGKIAAPRMLVAQFDNLVYNAVLETYREKLLRDLDWLFSQDKRRWWFTIYVIVFILLREVSRMTADRYRHARENFGTMPRYSIPTFVETVHISCNSILTLWHYYNCNEWPRTTSAKNAAHFASLTSDNADLIRETRRDKCVKEHLFVWKQYRANNGKVNESTLGKYPGTVHYTGNQDKFAWDHPLYWVAQMFEKNWYPHPTYQRETTPESPFHSPISTPG
ncbi:hypothetical protein FIE12Z_940 [Fusarium flagelliforme]|uniref:Zn(2)-C6 fungal-type domain-containing protein n=1 Tax=Fusarium flagelliforme TaxID=2675880 RepID=A0A395N3R1_9HYPO|nr:hypothetical protein FIE12Z_940 [Fusarium flagelliforme]